MHQSWQQREEEAMKQFRDLQLMQKEPANLKCLLPLGELRVTACTTLGSSGRMLQW